MKFSFDEYLVFILLEFYLFNHFLLYGPFNTLKFALKKVLSSNNFELTHNTTNNIKEKKPFHDLSCSLEFSHNPRTPQGSQDFEPSLGCMLSYRPTWSRQDPVSKQ